MDINDEDKSEIELINAGSEIAGGAAGAAIGVLIAGPGGAVLGGASGPLIVMAFRHIGREIKHRLLGPREEMRIGATMAYAINKIKEKIENGEKLRDDDFFNPPLKERAPVEEIYEGILLSAQKEHEERKIHFFGNLMANIAFHPEVSKSLANLLIKIAADLSYQQLVILGLLSDRRLFGTNLAHIGEGGENIELRGLIMEINDLHAKALINPPTFHGFGIKPSSSPHHEIQGISKILIELMELENIDENDKNYIISLLKILPGRVL